MAKRMKYFKGKSRGYSRSAGHNLSMFGARLYRMDRLNKGSWFNFVNGKRSYRVLFVDDDVVAYLDVDSQKRFEVKMSVAKKTYIQTGGSF